MMYADGYEPDLEQVIEDVFDPEPFGPVDEQLLKWLIFSLTGKGRQIGSLDALNYTLFKKKLDVLLPAVYNYQVEKMKSTEAEN